MLHKKNSIYLHFHSLLSLLLVFVIPCELNSQADRNYIVGAGIKLGSSVGLGSVSKNSSKYNAFGKYRYAVNSEIYAELIYKGKYSFGLGYRYLDYSLTSTNSAFNKAIKEKIGSQYSEPNGDESSLAGGFFSLSASRIFQYKKIRLQTKMDAAIGIVEYMGVDRQSTTIGYQGGGYQATQTTYRYDCDQTPVVTLIPEVNLQYILSRKKYLDFVLSLNAALFHINPKIRVNETTQISYSKEPAKTSSFVTIKDRVNMLNINLGFAVYLKRKQKN